MTQDYDAGLPATLWGLVEYRAQETPDGEMAVDERGRRVTFSQFREQAVAACGPLAAAGVQPGTVVSWQLPTTIEALVLAAALARLGAVQNPVIPGYGQRNLEFAVRQAGARLLITTPRWTSHALGEQARAVAARLPGLAVAMIEDLTGPGRPAPPGPVPQPAGPPPPGTARWIFYTSGTTAEPKGARHTDAAGLSSGYGMAIACRLTGSDRVGMAFPVAHIGGCGTWLAACLYSGCTLILDQAFDLEKTAALQRRENVTITGSGTVFTQLYLGLQRRQPGEPLFPRVRMLTAGAAPRPPALHAEVKAEMGGIGVLSGYGMTEAPILTMASVTDPDDKLAVTEGRPCPGVRVMAGPDGELRVKGPQVMLGYVDEALNADAFDDRGYLRTGDLGLIDEDGYVAITGRLKDVIIRKGETISARSVEVELMAHEAIAEAVVVGLPHPGNGEQACAVVILADGHAAPGLQEVRAHLKGRGLARFCWPERLEVAAALPRTTTGKVRKDQLREQLLSGGLQAREADAELSADVEARLRRLSVAYARGVDQRDRALFLSAFHPDATLAVPSGEVLAGREQLGRVTEAIKRHAATFHLLGQGAYWADGDGFAGEVYCVARHVRPDKSQLVLYIRYCDRYVRDGPGFLISARRVDVDMKERQHDERA